ncbi:hypothetical protein [Rubrivirga sp.]|uniref:hypothetical protein n=1 Tax=Rubrivirga sp. TaxID=1885344 RepID=UPI003B51E5BC
MARALLFALALLVVSAPTALAQFSGAVPNDPIYDSGGPFPPDPGQWNLRDIRMPEAWGITTGADDVIVAVIDTKFDLDHPDLEDA